MESKPTLLSYGSPKITVERLDEMVDFIKDGNGVGKMAWIIAAAKLILVSAYLIARRSLIQNNIERAAQQKLIDDQIGIGEDLDNGFID